MEFLHCSGMVAGEIKMKIRQIVDVKGFMIGEFNVEAAKELARILRTYDIRIRTPKNGWYEILVKLEKYLAEIDNA